MNQIISQIIKYVRQAVIQSDRYRIKYAFVNFSHQVLYPR